jgi:hypothetical protein
MSIPDVLVWLEDNEDDVSQDGSGEAGKPTQDMGIILFNSPRVGDKRGVD